MTLIVLTILLLAINSVKLTSNPITILTPSPTPFNPFPYHSPVIPANRAYVIFFVGDSHTEALGGNADGVRTELIKLYPNNDFASYNYGFGSTSILDLDKRLHQETTYKGTSFPSILSQRFDLIVIESFAYNPLSQYPQEQGIKIHLQKLEEAVTEIIKTHPDSVVALMTPIAPSKEFYAKFTYDLSPEQRRQWAEERISYINAVARFANEKQLPLIDNYKNSLTPDGAANLKYINPSDYIHPSKEGVKLMNKTIADFIYQNNIFEH